jgi:4-hydroxy-L-threonine phosphate dehydrogenase PdxA
MIPPLIAVTSGEPSGIGPDLCLRLAEYAGPARPVILADRALLRERAAAIGLQVGLRDYHPEIAVDRGCLDVLHVPLAKPAVAGSLDPANAPYVLAMLDRALAGCRSGEFAAMVTGPVHKGVINVAGVHFTGHTEYLAERTGTPLVVMMLAGSTGHGPLRVALATTHLPLKEVPAAITPDLLERTLRILMPISGKSTGWRRRASWSPASIRMPAKAVISAARKSRLSPRCWKSCAAKACSFPARIRPTPCLRRRSWRRAMRCSPCTTTRG